jgi:hypothetical protein
MDRLLIVLLGSASALALVIAALTRKSSWLPQPWQSPLAWLPTLLLCGGLALTLAELANLRQAARHRQWPTAEAAITTAVVSGPRNTRPEIHYRYTVKNRTYDGVTDLAAPAFGFTSGRRQMAETIVTESHRGTTLRVYYHPDYPWQSLAKPGPTWDVLTRLSLGLLLYLVGGVGFFHICMAACRRSAAPAGQPRSGAGGE